MATTFSERAPDQLQIIKEAIHGALANIWGALPCEVLKYDADAVTIDAQPLIKIPIRKLDGDIETIALPPLMDVPVMFTCAGGFTITHPINVGDECFVVFASRNIDIWWQQGGIQNPFDTRKHDLSDGFAFFRPQSQKNKISGISTSNLEIRTDNNACKIQITPSGEIHFIGTKSVFHHPVELQGSVDVKGKATMSGGASIDGIEFKTHKHDKVQSGGSDSGGPK